MSSSLFSRQGLAAALFAIGLALLFSLSLGSATADAAPTFKGNANVVLGAGKTGAFLTRSGVKVNRVGAAKVNRKGKRFVVKMPVRKLVSAKRSDVSLKGGFVLRKGKHAVRVRAFNVAVLKSGKIGIGGSIQKIKPRKSKAIFVNIFNVAGKANVKKQGRKTTLRIKNRKVSFTNAVVKKVRNQLRLNRVPRGHIANLNLNAVRTDPKPVDPCVVNPDAEGCPLVDPYLAECGVEASAKVPGSLPAPAPLPVLSGALETVGSESFDWGVKSSFRSYVVFGASGSLKALDGASTIGGPPVISAFSFPTDSGQYAANNPADNTDDQVILNGTGSAAFCATGHGFRVVVSNPTLVIDGGDSRIIADVDANLSGNWVPTQRVDLASLDLHDITPIYNKSGSEVSWVDVPATLTESGANAICGVGAHTACSYTQGTDLDPVSVTVQTPYDTGAGDAAAWDALATYVATNLPFPNSDPVQGGCEVGVPDQEEIPISGNARTIDEHVALGGTASKWFESPGAPVPAPEVSGVQVTDGGLDWGVRSGLRGTVNATGEFNLFGGTEASSVFYGHGAPNALTPVAPPRDPAGAMSGPGKYFTWPHDSGVYNANGAGDADDQLILEGKGRVSFCQTQSAQRYGIIIGNPRVIIDGANSRITADVTVRYRLSWARATVDLASIDPGFAGVTVGTSGAGTGTLTKTFTFPDGGAIKLTADGAKLAGMLSPTTYVEGANLDGAVIRASFPE